MKFRDVARFEFRMFGVELSALGEAFAVRGTANPQPLSREAYIVSRLNTESNVKIRDGRLDVKGLLGRLGVLEQWQPVLSAELPVAADVIENVVVPALGLDVDIAKDEPFTQSALLAWAGTLADLASVVVEKQRTLFDLGACEAEVTQLAIGADRLQSIAVEGPDADAVRALLEEVGLANARNESYAAYLQRRLF